MSTSRTKRFTSSSIKKFSSISSHSKSRELSIYKKDKSNEGSFIRFLRKLCENENILLPSIKIVSGEMPSGDFSKISDSGSQDEAQERRGSRISNTSKTYLIRKGERVQLYALYDNLDYPNIMNAILMRSYPYDNSVLTLFHEMFEKYNTITTLRLEFCNLNANHIEALTEFLFPYDNITDISLNGNPNEEQNFHLIVMKPGLQHVSFKCCQLDDVGAKNISSILSNFENQTVLTLNLAYNHITDEGAEGFADMLRANRTLIYLNLADNYITDLGCILIVNVLQKFPLTHEEIVRRRRKNMERLRKSTINEMRRSSLRSRGSSDMKIDQSVKMGKKQSGSSLTNKRKGRKKSVASDVVTLQSKESNASNKKRKSADSALQRITVYSIDMPVDNHPFMTECYPENKEIYCIGNLTLTHLNLSYNRITNEGMKAIIAMIEYQKSLEDISKGLRKLLIEGNLILEDCPELAEIQLLMTDRSRISYGDMNRSIADRRKRKSSIRSMSSQ